MGSAEMPHGNSIVYLIGMFAFFTTIFDSNKFYNYDKKHLNLLTKIPIKSAGFWIFGSNVTKISFWRRRFVILVGGIVLSWA